MVDWLDSTEEELYSHPSPFGGYIIFGDTDEILAYGAAYPAEYIEPLEVELEKGNWVMRPIYSFKW